MADPRTRDRIIELVRDMREHTVANGCTPGEAAKFAAKCAEWIERHQIEEAELRAAGGESAPEEVEVCEHTVWTGKRVFNPGVSAVVNGLAQGMCCKCVLAHSRNADGESEAVYGIIGEVLGCVWGGRWARLRDYGHLEFHAGFTLQHFLNAQKDGIVA